jgi:EpsI family protein
MDRISINRTVALVVILAALCAYTWMLRLRSPAPAKMPAIHMIPKRVDSFSARDEYIAPESLRLLGADTTLARSYISPSGETIELFIGWFADQREDSQIHSPKHCYPGSGWDIIREGSVRVRSGGSPVNARELVISDGKEKRLVVYWFNMQDKIISNEFALKYHQMLSTLLSRQPAAAFVRFSINLPVGEVDAARGKMIGFIEALLPDILKALAADERPEAE